MGNESSIPEDSGLQPPSQIPPQTSFDTANESRGSGKALSKALKATLQRGTVEQDSARLKGDNHYPHAQQSQQQTFTYNSQQTSGNNDYNKSQLGTPNQKTKHVRQSSLDPSQTIPVMYASEGGASMRSNQNSASGNSSATGLRNGGRALINSMRNLTVGTGNLKTTGLSRKVDPVQKEENEWETRWDADDDDSDGEEEVNKVEQDPKPVGPPKLSSTIPVDLLSEPVPTTTLSTQKITASPQILHRKDASTQDLSQENELRHELKLPAYERPNVQMFLPLLRVLGKGSFGKVVLVQKRSGNESGTMFAMKILRKTHLMKRRQIERTRTERKVLSVVDHP
eukprot:CAMPEP_0194191416 /NCGR_PEP_ID=MMETSP0154-20130528/66726_1 /TAXON_ID=1049557 /ORGANISM="Thalassiothrix antarctica, Strain L6-D1" /LENGTH=339 /DNA_ID=CAMNT_0038914059 /DNA_START=206 /DNA_END=1221 /DNA_ORIENTATION=-